MYFTLFLAAIGAFLLYRAIVLMLSDCDLKLRSHAKLPYNAFKGKTAWIVGASSGIGEALAVELAGRGCRVILSARREDELQRVAERCKAVGAPEARVLPLDALAFDTHEAAVNTIYEEWQWRVDYFVANSGRSQRSLAAETALEVHRQMFELNVIGIISVTKAILPRFIAAQSGHIMVTSSVAGKVGSPVGSCYAGTKHALQGYFKSLRMELASYNIPVTLVCPGPVATPIQQHAFSAEVGKTPDTSKADTTKRVSAERCAFLMACALQHKLSEVWISPHPILLFTYFSQYCPDLATFLGNRVGPKRVAAFKNSGELGYTAVTNPVNIIKGIFSKSSKRD